MSDEDNKRQSGTSGGDSFSAPPSEDSWDLDEFASDRSAPPNPGDITLSPVTLEPTYNIGATSKIPDNDPDVWDRNLVTRHPLMQATGKSVPPPKAAETKTMGGDDSGGWDLDEFSSSKPVASQPVATDDEPIAMTAENPPEETGWDLNEFSSRPADPAQSSPISLSGPLPTHNDDEPIALEAEPPPDTVTDDSWSLDEFSSPAPVAPFREISTVSTGPSDEPVAMAASILPGLSVESQPVSMPADNKGETDWGMEEFEAPENSSSEVQSVSSGDTLDRILEVEEKDAWLDTSAAAESWSVQPMRNVGQSLSTGQDPEIVTSTSAQLHPTTGNDHIDVVLEHLASEPPSANRDLRIASVYIAACGRSDNFDSRWLTEARRLIGDRNDPAAAALRARIAVIEESSSDELERLGSGVGGGPASRAPWIAESLRRAIAENADERAIRLAWALAEIDPGHPLARWVQARHLPKDRLAETRDEALQTVGSPAAAIERARLLAVDLAAGNRAGNDRISQILSALGTIPTDHPLASVARELGTRINELQLDWNAWTASMSEYAATLQGAEQAAVLYRLARILHEELGDLDGARQIYEKLLAADTENLVLLKLLEDVERRSGRPDILLTVFDAQYRVFKDEQLRAITAVKAGQVAEDQLRNPQAAIDWYSRALEADPRNPFALSSIGRLFAKAGEWEKLAQVYEFEAEGATDKQQKVDFMLKHAELLAERLNQREMAINVLRSALLIDDSNLNIYRELGRQLSASQQWEDLIRLYQAEVTLTRDKSRLVAIYMSLGELWQKDFQPSEPVDKFAQAVESYYHALEVEPDYTPALRTLGRLFYATENWDLLIRVYEREMELLESPRAKAAIRVKIAEIAEDRKKDLSLAIDNLRQALELDPANQMVINHLSRLSPTQKNWDDLVEVYIREAQMTRDRRYAAALHQLIGEIWRDRFQFIKKSADNFEKAIELDPSLESARQNLERTRFEQRTPAEQIEDIQAYLASGTPQSPSEVERFVSLLATSPELITDSRLALVPDRFCGRALIALEPVLNAVKLRLLAERAASADVEESAYARRLLIELPGTDEIAETAYIETLLRGGGLSMADMERIYARLSSRKPSLGHWELKVALHERLGRGMDGLDDLIWEGIGLGGTSSRLLPLLAARVKSGDSGTGILESLHHVALEAGNTELGLLAIEKLLASGVAGPKREKLLTDRAQLLASLPDRKEAALDAAREVFKLNPDSEIVVSLIGRLSAELGRSDDARLFAERRLAKATSPVEKALATVDLARISIDLEKNQEAGKRILDEALSLDPACISAHQMKVSLLEQQGNSAELASALEAMEPQLQRSEQIAVRERLATIYGEELREPERQLLHLEALVGLEPQISARHAALARFHRTRNDWPELFRSLMLQARCPDTEASAAERLVSDAARIAIDRQLTEADLGEVFSWASSQLDSATDKAAMLTATIDTARALDRPETLAPLLEKRAAMIADEKKQVADLIEAAKLYETVLGHADKAQQLYATAAELDDTHPAALMAQAEKLFREEDYGKALPIIRKAFGAGIQKSEPRIRADANYMMGVCLQAMGDAEQARGAFLRVIEDQPTHRDALMSLAEYDGQKGDWAAFTQRLEQVLKNATEETPQFRSGILKRIAHAHENSGKSDEALRSWEAVVREDPTASDALEAVVRLAMARGLVDRANTALEILAHQSESLMDNTKAARYRLEIARNLGTHAGDSAKALVEYRKVLDLDSNTPEALFKVAEADFSAGKTEEAEELLKRFIKVGRADTKLMPQANALLGKIAIAKGDSTAAQTYLEQAQQQGTEASATAEAMVTLHEKNGEWEKAEQTLEKLADSMRKDNPREAVPFLIRRARILKAYLNRRDDAIMEIRRAIRLDPQNLELHEMLAGIFRENVATIGEAIKAYQAILHIDPFHLHTYDTLATIYSTDFDKRFCAGQALIALTGPTTDIADWVAAQKRNQPNAPKGKFNPAQAGRQFWHPACQHFLHEFLPQLAMPICKSFPTDFVKLGVRPEPLAAGTIPEAIQRVMEQIGPVENLIFVRDTRRPLQMGIERGPKGPVVLIGDQLFETVKGPEASFVAARSLFALVDGSWALSRLDADTVHRLLALYGRAIDENFKIGGDPAAIKRDVKLVEKEISRGLRKELQAKLPKYREAHTRVVVQSWLDGIQCSRDRFGLVMCGHLEPALIRTAVRLGVIQQEPLPDPKTWPDLFREQPQFGELLRYSVSEDYFLQRRNLGMALDSI
ncbi:MAG: tetratricopeptide repeat protein [Deltaproteobacteria bacterium]|nr:tetratricopeptide repeat protein [Deltaproteobacteria bacterium]